MALRRGLINSHIPSRRLSRSRASTRSTAATTCRVVHVVGPAFFETRAARVPWQSVILASLFWLLACKPIGVQVLPSLARHGEVGTRRRLAIQQLESRGHVCEMIHTSPKLVLQHGTSGTDISDSLGGGSEPSAMFRILTGHTAALNRSSDHGMKQVDPEQLSWLIFPWLSDIRLTVQYQQAIVDVLAYYQRIQWLSAMAVVAR